MKELSMNFTGDREDTHQGLHRSLASPGTPMKSVRPTAQKCLVEHFKETTQYYTPSQLIAFSVQHVSQPGHSERVAKHLLLWPSPALWAPFFGRTRS